MGVLVQLLCDELIDLARIGLALGGLHDRTHDGTGDLLIAGTVLFHNVRVGGQRVIYGLLDGAIIAYDLQATLFDDLVDVTLARQHTIDGLACELGGSLPSLTSAITRAT